MFERFTEQARRAIFFARHETAIEGSDQIEDRHFLLGLLRESKVLHGLVEQPEEMAQAIRAIFVAHFPPAQQAGSTSVDLPLSDDVKRMLELAAEEAQQLGHKHIGSMHLLLGVLRAEDTLPARTLVEKGVGIERVREYVRTATPEPFVKGDAALHILQALIRDLPDGRNAAATRLMSALQWDQVEFQVSGSGGSFIVRFPAQPVPPREPPLEQ